MEFTEITDLTVQNDIHVLDTPENRKLVKEYVASLHHITKKEDKAGGQIIRQYVYGYNAECGYNLVQWHREIKPTSCWQSGYRGRKGKRVTTEGTPAYFVINHYPVNPIRAELGWTKEAELAMALQSHDWTYEMADDRRSYQAGLASQNKIIEMARELANLPEDTKQQIIRLAKIKNGRFSRWFFKEFQVA